MPILDIAVSPALLAELTELSIRAAQAIRNCAGDIAVRRKADGSPVTTADEAAEAEICAGLARLAPGVPVISEEQATHPAPARTASYFLVDPLDGTREFVDGRDEYTVNIALIQAGAPILGVITAPVLGLTWRGIVGRGAERIAHHGAERSAPTPIRTRPRNEDDIVVLASRSHLDAHTRAYLDRLPQARLAQCGSSIKFCRLAEGAADLYPRLAPIHDWDIAAGHAILEAAGGTVVAPDGAPLVYGSPNLLIAGFVASGAPVTA